MKLKSLRLQNFMLYRKFFRVFSDKDVIGIIAEYADNEDRSNRGGKTTIIEAIRYCLFGSSRAEREVDLIHHGEDEMWVELILEDGKETHSIKRGRSKANVPILEVDRIQKSGEAQSYINQLLGFNEREFELTCFFKQQEINQLMEMSPRDKQKHLMQWLKNDHWMKLERVVLDDLKTLQRQVIELEARRKTLKERAQDDSKLVSMIVELKSLLQERIIERDELQKQLDKLKQRRLSADDRKKLKQEIRTYTDQVSSIASKLKSCESVERKIKGEKEQIKLLSERLKKLPNYTRDMEIDLRNDMVSRGAAIEALSSQIETANEHFTGTCPILSAPCDRISFDAKKVKQWEKAQSAMEAELTKSKALLTKLNQARVYEDERKSRLEAVKRLTAGLGSPKELRADLARFRSLLRQKEDQLVRDSAAGRDEVDVIDEKLSSVNDSIDDFKKSLAIMRDRRKQAKDLKKEVDKLEIDLTALQRKISQHRYLAYMFGKGGIPSQEIENAFDEIEDETNFILQKFGTNLAVQFNPDRELKSWEEACLACGTIFPKGKHSRECSNCGTERQHKRRDELSIKVLENGTEQNFAMESGGGKTLVSFSNRLALTRLIQRKTGSKFNVLFLDEPDSALDPVNKSAFMDLISKTLIKQFSFQQVFWITHSKEIQESIPNVLKVTRHQKHSTAAWL